jgi:hypothetical protein
MIASEALAGGNNMKKTASFVLAASMALAALTTSAAAQYGSTYGSRSYGSPNYGTGSNSNSNRVDGYTRSNGTYVQPYQRTNPNSSTTDNYGARGNYNPYSGRTSGSRSRF